MRGFHLFSATLLAAALSTLAPHPACAVDDCFDCVLGIWDDPGMTANFGTIPIGTLKDIYVGIDFAGGFNGLNGIQFSIAGIRVFTLRPIRSCARRTSSNATLRSSRKPVCGAAATS